MLCSVTNILLLLHLQIEMWTACIEEKLKERNTTKQAEEPLVDMKHYLDEITTVEDMTVDVICPKTYTKKQKKVQLYKLKPAYETAISITTGFNPEVWEKFGTITEEEGVVSKKMEDDENTMLAWLAHHFVKCVVNKEDMVCYGETKLFDYATQSDIAFLLLLMEQHYAQFFHVAICQLKIRNEPSAEEEARLEKNYVMLMSKYGAGGNGLSSEQGGRRFDQVLNHLFDFEESRTKIVSELHAVHVAKYINSRQTADKAQALYDSEESDEFREEAIKAKRKRDLVNEKVAKRLNIGITDHQTIIF